jgi:alpha-L-fucosidase 2
MSESSLSRRALIGGAAGAAGAAAFVYETFPAEAATAAVPAGAAPAGLNDTMSTDAAWSAFLGTSDLVWSKVPTTFYQSAFLGNGGLAAAVYQTGSAKRLTWRLGDSRVRDHQGTGGTLFGNARLPVGDLTLNTSGDVTAVSLRLSLWNAELSGTVTTTKGVLNVRTFVHGKRDVLVVAVSVKSGGETWSWKFTPAVARSPRLDFKPAPSGLKTNPAATVSGTTATQNLAAGGQTVTKWQTRTESDGKTQTLLATVAHTFPGSTAGSVASSTLSAANGQTLDALATDHRSWWHGFYPKSFLTVPETRLQSFYWIQLYKIASATRRDRPVVATHGPWLEKTPWPGVWWNLNVQLEYWLINATGHTELDSLSASLDRSRNSLATNVPSGQRSDSYGMARTSQEDLVTGTVATPGSGGEVGDLTWAIHNAWLTYRHTMDDAVLSGMVFPLLRKAINYYLHFLAKDSSGTYHLPSTFSPEFAAAPDCNYDLALIHWGCATLLASAKRLGITDPLAGKWQDVLSHLTKPPQDGTDGFFIGAGVKLTSGHRHYSHLLWFYPLYQLDVTTSTANRTALTRSLSHWLSFSSGQQGYTFTGSGSMYAVLGDGNHARAQLGTLLDRFVQPNTMYKESGPVIETPLSGAQTMHDMVVQSWGGTVRVFPGTPSAWPDATIHNLRTEGAFLLSAVRKGGVTQFIRVKSLAGEPLRVAPGNLPGPWDVQTLPGSGAVTFTVNSDSTVTINLASGDDVVIITKGSSPDLTIAPVPGDGKRYWGLP